MKSRAIAISAISASIIALILTLGAYVQVTDVFCVIVASVFSILPIYYKSYLGCFMAYLAGGVIAFLISGFNVFSIVFPAYMGFFGIFPIVKCIMVDKKFNVWAGMAIGLIWCVGAIFGLYFYYVELVMDIRSLTALPTWIMDNIYIFVALFGVIMYFLFERFVVVTRLVYDRYLGKIIKK